MCLSTAMYCFVFSLNTHFFTQESSNILLGVFWIMAYSSYYCYLRAIEAYLGYEIRLLKISKVYSLFLTTAHSINTISTIFLGKNFLFEETNKSFTLFSKAMSLSISPNYYGLALGIVGAVIVFYSSVIIWRELSHRKVKERLLQYGVLVTVICVINDSALGLELTGGLIPLYYLGNAFEAVRLNLHYQKMSHKKINKLEYQVDELTKTAQFGFAAASISHDIKNYLMIIKYSLKKALSRDDKEKHILKAQKYINQTSEVTALYMDLFKNNTDITTSDTKLINLVNEAVEIVQDKISKARIKLRVNIDEERYITCNSVAFTLCLVNLLGNAVEAISEYDEPWIEIELNDIGNSLLIRDCGLGIPKDIADKVFDVNFTTKKNYGGSGLGLAISKKLLQKSGQDIQLDSTHSHTLFVISL